MLDFVYATWINALPVEQRQGFMEYVHEEPMKTERVDRKTFILEYGEVG